MLCSLCKDLPPLRELSDFEYPTIPALRRSASAGCEFCSLVSAAISDILPPESRALGLSTDVRTPVKISLCHKDASTFIKVWQWSTSNCGYLEVCSDPSSTDTIKDSTQTPNPYPSKRPLPDSHQSDSTFEFIQATIQNCQATHSGCPRNDDVVLPTFIVDVQTAQEPFLVQNDGTQRGSYIALSYCWGPASVQELTWLTKARLPSYLKCISLASLPQTLQDAVSVTHRLGIQYLWIDSMCIPQDDEEIRQQQLRVMADIYTQSFATIQASIPHSASDGFLALSRNPYGVPVRLPFERDLVSGHTSFAIVRFVPVRKGDEASADQRAWIFQETVLPVRVVRYCATLVVVSCRHEICTEDGCEYDNFNRFSLSPRAYYHIRPDLRPDSIPPEFPRIPSTNHQKQALESWYRNLQMFYSPRVTSVSDDRLVALSAYAREAHSVIGGNYLAGNWSVDLRKGLRWQPWGALLQRAVTYRAPSWSWAAYDGNVCHLYSKTDDDGQDGWMPTIVDAWTKTDTSPYGACRAGKIVMKTRVFRFSITGDLLNNKTYAGQSTALESDVVQLQGNKESAICYAYSDTTAGIPKDKVLCGAFISHKWGLVLAKSDGSDTADHSEGREDEFIRVGHFRTIRGGIQNYQQKKIVLI
ncbi:heterokaryon incompatibility protein-domain-containing protein [Hypoxylon trugodes]|uniref:heterokaryon incompatibility protein-domain-containing protein n=1 Tax=Hypoxylon trugodes TaxID=326681 RepID=UPI0021978525|nr:heterokaryon incompatibility protein-domain-containing protein [Hypoxylon trugodes]KAI1388522.1 heterokaryon incompatibility protein-domain-containing protein [Hypoxylon trugodes]